MMSKTTPLLKIAGAGALALMAFFTTTFPMEPRFSFVSSLMVIIFAIPCYVGVIQSLGKRNGVQLILLMCVFAIVLENIAIITGFPYGRFEYRSFIGQNIGHVPWTVGFAWTPILFGALSLTRKYLSSSLFPAHTVVANAVISIVATAALMTLFDVVLDPGSVSLGFWVWENSAGFYGVPWSNFFGWLLSSACAAVAVQIFLKLKRLEAAQFSPLMHSSFIAMLVFWTAVCMFEQLWIPGLIGCVFLAKIKIVGGYSGQL